MARVADVGEDLRLTDAVAVIAAQAECRFKVVGGPGEVPEVKLGVTEGVPDVVLEMAAAELGDQGQGLLAERACQLVIAEEGVVPSDAIEHLGLRELIAAGLKEAQRLFVMTEGVGAATLNPGYRREILLGPGLPHAVIEPLVQREGALQMKAGLIIVSSAQIRVSQAAHGHGLPERVVKAGRGCQRTLHYGDPLLQVASPVEIYRQYAGELPGVAVSPRLRGEGDGGEQHLVLGFEPGQGCTVIGGPLRAAARARRRQAERLA